MEYNEFPGEQLNYMVIINEKGEVKQLVGSNTIKDSNPINNKFFGGIIEADYIKNTTFPEQEDYYYAQINLLYGNPSNPSVSERSDTTCFFNRIPSSGTAYYFSPKANGIESSIGNKISICPNPVKHKLTFIRNW